MSATTSWPDAPTSSQTEAGPALDGADGDGVQHHVAFYLAARYSRRLELCGHQAELETLGHTVTSRWLLGNHQAENDQLQRGADAERFADEDLADVRAADVLVAFTEPPRSSNSRGGRHVEFGYALALGIHVVIVGPRENVFGCLVPQFDSWAEARRHLLPEAATVAV